MKLLAMKCSSSFGYCVFQRPRCVSQHRVVYGH